MYIPLRQLSQRRTMDRNRDSFVGSCSTVFVMPGSSLPAKATGHPYHDLCWKSSVRHRRLCAKEAELAAEQTSTYIHGVWVDNGQSHRLPPNLYFKQNLNLLMSLERADSLKAFFSVGVTDNLCTDRCDRIGGNNRGPLFFIRKLPPDSHIYEAQDS